MTTKPDGDRGKTEWLLSTVLSSRRSWGALRKILGMIKDSPTGERGHIVDFHLITYKLASPSSSTGTQVSVCPEVRAEDKPTLPLCDSPVG